jgi:transcriptional regulator with XRE-family HTH domain
MAAKPELREFLVSRRAKVSPEQIGLTPLPGRRRVPGLRREELAQAAGVSVDYYVRLEQGRGINVSADVLDAVARTLMLDETERTYLFELATPAARRRRPAAAHGAQKVRQGTRLLVDSLDRPALVLGRRTDVLAANRLARALVTDFDALEPRERNHARWVFLDPEARERSGEWEKIARDTVGTLRLDAGRHPDDPLLNELIGELSVKCPEFSGWWSEHDVVLRTYGTKHFRHPIAGEVELFWEALPVAGDPDQTLFIYSAEPGSRSAQGMDLLASWIADAHLAPTEEEARS